MTNKGKGSPRRLGVAIGVLLAALIALVAAVGIEMASLTRRLDSRGEKLMSSASDNAAELDSLRRSMRLLADDSNEARRAVSLPARDYPLLRAPPPPSVRSEPLDIFLDGFDLLLRTRDRRAASRRIDRLEASPELLRLERLHELAATRLERDRLVLEKGERRYFTIASDPVSGSLRISDALGRTLTAASIDRRVADFVAKRCAVLDGHFARLSADLASLRAAATLPEVRRAARENELTLLPPESVEGGYRLLVRRAGTTLLTATLNAGSRAVTVGNRRYHDTAAFLAALPGELRRLDRTAAGRERVSAARRRIEALRGNKTFMLALSARRITLSTRPREDLDYYSYDFTDSDGVRIGSFAVQKKLGTIYLTDGNGVTIRRLTSAGTAADGTLRLDATARRPTSDESRPAGEASGAPGARQSRTADFLICGAHQNETDTIIVAHADRTAGRITLIGIPRDLYYKGRKINAVYERYGPRELAREASEITGLAIHDYVVIDMYAFIDVINILGGIDLNLRAPLVDPTYRVWERDGWSTLSYGAGMHHLDGTAALRVARSRNTSSDFVRAYRQQDILAAIRQKIDRMDLWDLSKIYNLTGVFFRYVDTNLTPSKLVGLILTFRDVPIAGNYVIDTENVLYQTYTNIYYLEDGGKQRSDGLGKGAWILLPRNDDWNVVRNYVHGILGGDAS